jgi:hypothetical protein
MSLTSSELPSCDLASPPASGPHRGAVPPRIRPDCSPPPREIADSTFSYRA